LIKLNETRGEWDRLRLPAEVWEDFLRSNLGGTCFSLTFFLWTILEFCGFSASPLIMDMSWSPAAHCGLLVDLDGNPHLVDPGYLLGKPIPLVQAESRHFHDNYTGILLRYDSTLGMFELSTFNRRERRFRYRFTPDPLGINEFLLFWKNSFYQKSMRHVCLTRLDPASGGRIYIRNDFIRHYTPVGKTNIALSAQAAAAEFFGIDPEMFLRARRLTRG
jgi:arylamine N-acetyltransferase